MFTLEFDREGGYDNQYSAWIIKRDGKEIVTIDCSSFGQGNKDDKDYDKKGAELVAKVCFEALSKKLGE